MSEKIRIADFGFAGLNADKQDTLLEPGEWSVLSNIDIESGSIRSAWGDTLVANNPPVVPRYAYVFEGETETYLIISDGNALYSFNGSVWRDITPRTAATGGVAWDDAGTIGDGTWDGAGTTWDATLQAGGSPAAFGGQIQFTVFLGILIVCPSDGVPAYWPNVGEQMITLPGWDLAWRAQQMHAYGNFLVAIGLDDGAVAGSKYRVAWSDAAVEGTVPQSWLPTPTNLAGSVQLRDTDGYLVTAGQLRDDLVIFKNDSVYRMFETGSPTTVMGFERVLEDRGCDSPRGVAAFSGMLVFADRGDVRIFDGQNSQSIAALKIRETLAAGISNEYRDATVIVAYPEREEVWVGVVPAGGQVISAVLIFNMIHKAWVYKRYQNALSMAVGPFSTTTEGGIGSWNDAVGSWDSQTDTWNASAFEPSEDGVIFGSTTQLWRADKTHTDQNGNPKQCLAERRGFIIAGMDHLATVKRVYPEIVGKAEVRIQIAAQWTAGGPLRWTPERPFRPGTDRSIPARITGQPVGFRIASNTPFGWRLGALTFEFTPASGR